MRHGEKVYNLRVAKVFLNMNPNLAIKRKIDKFDYCISFMRPST